MQEGRFPAIVRDHSGQVSGPTCLGLALVPVDAHFGFTMETCLCAGPSFVHLDGTLIKITQRDMKVKRFALKDLKIKGLLVGRKRTSKERGR